MFCILLVCFFLHRQLRDATLSLVMDHKYPSVFPTKCLCSIFKLKKALLAESGSHWHPQPVPKRIKLNHCSRKEGHGGSSWIKADEAKGFIAVTALSPFLAFHQVWCRVLLHTKGKSRKDENFQRNKVQTLSCGKFLLSVEDISAGKYSVNLENPRHTGKSKLDQKEDISSCSVTFSHMGLLITLLLILVIKCLLKAVTFKLFNVENISWT